MKLFLDENFPSVPAGHLLAQFPGSIYAATDDRFKGKPDSAIFRFLSRNPFILVTLDKDFANLVEYPPTVTAGIIVVRAGDMKIAVATKRLSLFLVAVKPSSLKGALTILSSKKVRTVRASRLKANR